MGAKRNWEDFEMFSFGGAARWYERLNNGRKPWTTLARWLTGDWVIERREGLARSMELEEMTKVWPGDDAVGAVSLCRVVGGDADRGD